VREPLPPVIGHEEEVLQAHAAVALAVHTGLHGNDIARDQRLRTIVVV
jgi:hypothetical protein